MKIIFYALSFCLIANFSFADDQPAKYENANGLSNVIGIVYPDRERPDTLITISQDSAKLLYTRLSTSIEPVKIDGVVNNGELFRVIGQDLICEKVVLTSAEMRFACKLVVDAKGAIKK